MSSVVRKFIEDSYAAGKNRVEVMTVLKAAGWEKEQVDEAFSAYVDQDFPVPIPKPVVFASPRIAFLNLFHFIVLYVCTYNVISILFTFLDYYLPDGLGRQVGFYYNSYQSLGVAIRENLAAIIVGIPLVFLTAYFLKQAMGLAKQRIPRIRLLLINFTMFVGACTMFGTASCFVYYLLSGELGARFIIKAVILAALVIGGFFYYRTEISEDEQRA